MKALIDAGVKASLADGDGRTPHELARMHGYDAIASLLEAAGARWSFAERAQ